ncbi:tetratricopeptide (TPR) repeat protein [Flavobacterium sp. 28A]|uniref:tetratricopeptide repeat protein n=1 Tax=Flavobacterium sp. 28A TaxID=2735895 RepID=UPI001570D36E|nr:tetratricopeptide repeat protein [Flavobacterium sp. 28A]NRT16222.1 tetratricopeptide (TPR) repeat protein [Flavobacterium sp. 28A]
MNELNYIVFDQYLQEEMSVEEKLNFEKQLAEDQEMASAFEVFKDMQSQLEVKFGFEEERNVFKDNLKSISDQQFVGKKSKVITLKSVSYLVAASVVLFLGLFLFNSNSNPNFEDFNQHENAYFTERGVAVANLKQAETAFNAKKYEVAIPLFESILKEKKTPEIQYFYGISLLETNKIKEADSIFNELKSGHSVYKNKAVWNLALSKLKQKEYKACKKILLTIPSDYENYEEVQKLLKKLD